MSKIVKTIDGHQGELLYIKDNTAFIKESNGEVWYCPKTDIIDEVSERDLFLDTIKEIVETNNWDGNKDKKIEHLQSQLALQELEKVKDWLNEPFDEDGCFKIGGDLIDFIDQQIKLLKGEKEVED